MENIKMKTFIVIVMVIMTVRTENFFAGLNIDPALLGQANAAITDLKITLEKNFDCQPRNTIGFGNMFSLISQFFPFSKLQGFSGFNARSPVVTCQLLWQGAVFRSVYQKVVSVTEQLQKVRNCLIQYNNVIVGNYNNVTGTNNLVIGSKDNFNGNNNWVFASDYSSTDPLNGVLIFGLYIIELSKVMQITFNPTSVIHCIQQEDSNTHFNNFWWRAAPNRRFFF